MRETAVIAVDVAPDELPAPIGAAIGEVEAAMREAGVGLAGPPFARYLAFEPRIRAEIGFPVQRPAPHVGRVFPGRLPGGRVASIVHIGSFDGLEQHVRPDAPLARRAGPAAVRPDLGGLLERPRGGARPGDLEDGDLRADRVAPARLSAPSVHADWSPCARPPTTDPPPRHVTPRSAPWRPSEQRDWGRATD